MQKRLVSAKIPVDVIEGCTALKVNKSREILKALKKAIRRERKKQENNVIRPSASGEEHGSDQRAEQAVR